MSAEREAAEVLRLAQHLASIEVGIGGRCDLTGDSDRCEGVAVAVRREDGFADYVCAEHAATAAARGALVVWPKRHGGTPAALAAAAGGREAGAWQKAHDTFCDHERHPCPHANPYRTGGSDD